MTRRVEANMSKQKAFEARTQSMIDMLLRDFCAHCEAPATGRDKCDNCDVGEKMGDLYWLMRANDPEYGA